MGVKNEIISLGDEINIDLRPITHIINKIGADVINASIVGTAYGFTIPDKIYLDLNKLSNVNLKELIPFIMLHEIAHHKRFATPDLCLAEKTKNISLLTEDEYCTIVITEELFANRWASLMYRVIYKESLPDDLYNLINSDDRFTKLKNNSVIMYNELYKYGEVYMDFVINKLVNYVR
jgi:hypothetical protein